jgi:[ribosomal protein S18]-alanine N-acetyltransferase
MPLAYRESRPKGKLFHMEFTFRPLNWPDVESVTTWHYDAPYTQYDGTALAPSLRMYLLSRWLFTWLGYEFFAVDDEQGELIGIFSFKKLSRKGVRIGLGLRPDLSGHGYGLAFVQAGIEFGKQRYAPTSFQLTVAIFNERAIKVYKRAGFTIVKSWLQGGRWMMRRDA